MVKFDNFSNLSAEQKEALKKLLKSYTDMRITTFKSTFKTANEILESYKNYEIINFSNIYDPRVVNINFIYDILYQFEQILKGSMVFLGELLT